MNTAIASIPVIHNAKGTQAAAGAKSLVTDMPKLRIQSAEGSGAAAAEIVVPVCGETAVCMEQSHCIICESPAGRMDKKGAVSIKGNKNQIWY